MTEEERTAFLVQYIQSEEFDIEDRGFRSFHEPGDRIRHFKVSKMVEGIGQICEMAMDIHERVWNDLSQESLAYLANDAMNNLNGAIAKRRDS